jgi:type IV secretory pathway component VirB8
MRTIEQNMSRLIPADLAAFLAVARSKRAQSSLEYIMMVAAASVVIVLALAMVVKLKGAVVSNVSVNGNSMSVSQAISSELGSLTSNGV